MSVADHEAFRADLRQRQASLCGASDQAAIVEAIHAEVLDRIPHRRSEKGVRRVLDILDDLEEASPAEVDTGGGEK